MIRTTLVCMAIIAVAAPASAQDVIMRGRVHGTEIPDHVREWVARNPNAGEFQRAWKYALEEAKRARAQLRRQGVDAMTLSPRRSASLGAAVAGTFQVPVITILFSNTPSQPYPSDDLENLLYTGPSATMTLTEYYDEISRGIFNLTGTVLDWVTVSNSDTFYAGTTNGLGGDAQLGDLFTEALDEVDPTIDFSIYDSDSNGYVDFVAFIHPELDGACDIAGNDNIWSHKFAYRALNGTGGQPYPTDDGVYVDEYVIQPAVLCDGSSMIQIGVFAHEYGHALGLPDLYDTADDPTDPNDASEGIGRWGLMGSGNYNRPSSPAHMMAWSKAELGWMPVVEVSTNSSVILEPAETIGPAIRLNVPGIPGEYFLLENRQPIGSDQFVHGGGGLLVWHVDSTVIANNSLINQVNGDETHKGVGLEEADGLNDLDGVAGTDGNRGDPGDPFPGSTGNTSFSDLTNPNSDGYSGVPSGIALNSISLSGQDMTFNVTFGTPGTTTAYWGDVTEDDVIDEADVEAILTALIGGTQSADMSVADVDADGDADARDGLIVHSYVVGMDLSGCAACRVGDEVSGSPVAPEIIVRRPVGEGDPIRVLIQRVNGRGFEE